jgi:hypothetical protein
MHPAHVYHSGPPQAPIFQVLPARSTKSVSRPFYLLGPSVGFKETDESFPTSTGNKLNKPAGYTIKPNDHIPTHVRDKSHVYPRKGAQDSSVDTPPPMTNHNIPQVLSGPSYDVFGKSRPSYKRQEENELKVGPSSKQCMNKLGGGTEWSDRMGEEGTVQSVGIPPNIEQNEADKARPSKSSRHLAPIPLNFDTVYGPAASSQKQPEAQKAYTQAPSTDQQTHPAKTSKRLGEHTIPEFPVKSHSEHQEDHYRGNLRGGASASQPTKSFTQTEDYLKLRDLVLASEPDYDFSGAWDGSTRIGRVQRAQELDRLMAEGLHVEKQRDPVSSTDPASISKYAALLGKVPTVRGGGWDDKCDDESSDASRDEWDNLGNRTSDVRRHGGCNGTLILETVGYVNVTGRSREPVKLLWGLQYMPAAKSTTIWKSVRGLWGIAGWRRKT